MMKSKIIYLFIALLAATLSSCSKNDVIVQEPEYPLDNGQWYQLEGSTGYYTDMIYFDKNVFHYERLDFKASCNYTYKHPIVTLIWAEDTTYQVLVGEDYLKFHKDGKDYFFYSKGEKTW